MPQLRTRLPSTSLQAGSHDIDSLRGTGTRHEKGHDAQGFSAASEAGPVSDGARVSFCRLQGFSGRGLSLPGAQVL